MTRTTESQVEEIRSRYTPETIVMVTDPGLRDTECKPRYSYGFGPDIATLQQFAPVDRQTGDHLYPIPFDRSHETISRMMRAGLHVVCIERVR